MSKDIGIGVIGLGMGATMFPQNIRGDTRFKVRGICGLEPKEKVKDIMERWNIDFFTSDYRELVKRKDIDVIGVYSPDFLHGVHCKAALEAGKHVVCTKPLTDNLKEAIELVNLVKKTSLKFLVGQTLRYDPQIAALRKFYDDGDIGRIIFAEAHYIHDMRPIYDLTPWRLKHPQDFMFGGTCHPIDALRWFLGDVDELHAFGKKGEMSPYPIMDNYILNLKFKNGVIARALGLYGVVEPPEPMMKLSIFGDRGSGVATYTDNKGGSFDFVYDKIEYKPIARMEFPPEPGIDVYGHTKTVERYMKHFEDCLTNDKEPSPSVIDGAKTISVGDAAWKSIKTGKLVKVFNEF